MRSLRSFEIIHLFAVLHAAVAVLCRVGGVDDELALTLLSILMIVLLCLRRGLNVEFTAACIIVVNVFGYLLGTGAAALLGRAMASQPLAHACSSFLTTEALGWGVVGLVKLFRPGESAGAPLRVRTPRVGLLLLAVGAIFSLRLAYVELLRGPFCSLERIYAMRDALWSSSPALIILLCADVIYVRSMRRDDRSVALKTLRLLLFLLSSSLVGALAVGLQRHVGGSPVATQEFAPLLLVALVSEATLYSAVFIVDYALTARAGLRAERGRTHQAQFLYMKLKQQVNPHFLINSLNILDCLVCEERTAQASDFIHKLAGIYRYMLQNEQEPLVPMERELAFVGEVRRAAAGALRRRLPRGVARRPRGAQAQRRPLLDAAARGERHQAQRGRRGRAAHDPHRGLGRPREREQQPAPAPLGGPLDPRGARIHPPPVPRSGRSLHRDPPHGGELLCNLTAFVI